MKTKFIALITAGAIATAGLAPTTAQADQTRDMIGALIGFAALVAIVDAANRNPQPVHVSRNNEFRDRVYHNDRDKHRHDNRRQENTTNHKIMPKQCVRSRQTNQGWVRYYSEQCMSGFGWVRHNGEWTKRRHVSR